MGECIKIKDESTCCGCKNCQNICPKNAIKFKKNAEGFLYPHIDEKKCIKCGLCKRMCPFIQEIVRNDFFDKPKCYAAFLNDSEFLLKSTSGGAFYSMATTILNANGVVVGAAFDKNMKLKHIIVDNKYELYKIMGSKYIYSDLENIFIKIKELLIKNIKVLFSGLPCQISALKLFLKKEYDNLYTVEVICHGTPSQDLFDKYKEYLEKKYDGKLIDYCFRSKEKVSWGTFEAVASFKRKNKIVKKRINADFDKYYKNFLDANNYRESCYKCKFAKLDRNADVTLGDLWGIEKLNIDFFNKDGMSAIVINSKKGEELFNNSKKNLSYINVDYEFIYKNNGQLCHPSHRTQRRDLFYQNFESTNYFKNIKISKNYKSYLKIFVPSKIKIKIKKILNKIK